MLFNISIHWNITWYPIKGYNFILLCISMCPLKINVIQNFFFCTRIHSQNWLLVASMLVLSAAAFHNAVSLRTVHFRLDTSVFNHLWNKHDNSACLFGLWHGRNGKVTIKPPQWCPRGLQMGAAELRLWHQTPCVWTVRMCCRCYRLLFLETSVFVYHVPPQ